MQRIHAGLAVLIATLAAAPGAGAASAVVTADGRVLRVGSVVGSGRLDGETCVFGPESTPVFRRTTAASVTLRADDACRLVVTAVGADVPVGTYERAPKVDETAMGSTSDNTIGLTSLSRLASEALTNASSTEVKQVHLDQVVYDETGLRQYTDETYAEYVRNRKTGDVTNMGIVDGYCEGSAVDDALYGSVGLQTTEIHACYYKTTFDGPGHVAFVSGGSYRQKVLTYTRDERALTETFDAWRDGFYTWSCSPGSLPQRWSMNCDLVLV